MANWNANKWKVFKRHCITMMARTYEIISYQLPVLFPVCSKLFHFSDFTVDDNDDDDVDDDNGVANLPDAIKISSKTLKVLLSMWPNLVAYIGGWEKQLSQFWEKDSSLKLCSTQTISNLAQRLWNLWSKRLFKLRKIMPFFATHEMCIDHKRLFQLYVISN